ncbi:MAG: hypothetical protein GY701_32950, partial [Sulfitobacter sp.]|nr:hypothetical protein [Sulfitobacter sp.]
MGVTLDIGRMDPAPGATMTIHDTKIMNELNAKMFRNCFAGKWALVSLILVTVIGFVANTNIVEAQSEKPTS